MHTLQAQARGGRLRELRTEAAISPDGLAALAGIGHRRRRNGAVILRWEASAGCTVDALVQVAEVLARQLRPARDRAQVLAYLVWG